MSLTFIEFIWLLVAIVVTVIVIKVTISFDLNRYLEQKQKNLKEKAKNYCPHIFMKEIEGKLVIQSAYISPSGTANYICQRCGTMLYDIDHQAEESRVRFFLENPKELNKQNNKFRKLLKKCGCL